MSFGNIRKHIHQNGQSIRGIFIFPRVNPRSFKTLSNIPIISYFASHFSESRISSVFTQKRCFGKRQINR
ncbi:MAG: hypothetical protein B6244_07255 [Candidatus Cloacimonetes bacterium 4572_55]|nr:MAG: hypothetical protein B6244_07255 [Candidatus Cloacimonetes bacterium 4572_55]